MDYYLSKPVAGAYDKVVAKVREALAAQGFGVLTEIDIAATLKKKLDVDWRPYCILGACHPPSAYAGLQSEAHLGAMLPCNVCIQQTAPGQCEVFAIDPARIAESTGNPALDATAADVRARLDRMLASL